MEINPTAAPPQANTPNPTPADPQTTGQPVADAAAIKEDPHPEVPLPIPASPSQTGLVSKAALSDNDTAPKLDTTGVSSTERTLKPYGINMLPDRSDDAGGQKSG